MKRILLITIILICLTGCPLMEDFYGFNIINNTKSEIAFIVNVDTKMKTLYPDTMIPINPDIVDYFDPKWNSRNWSFRGSYEDVFKGQDTISIFILSVDTLKKYSWEQIRHDYNILIRYDLTYKDIRLLKDDIPYPPNESMRNMKMYPKYFKD